MQKIVLEFTVDDGTEHDGEEFADQVADGLIYSNNEALGQLSSCVQDITFIQIREVE